MHIIELAPGMGPADGKLDITFCREGLEARIAVQMKDTLEPFQMGGRSFGPAVRLLTVESHRRICAGPGPLIPHIDP